MLCATVALSLCPTAVTEPRQGGCGGERREREKEGGRDKWRGGSERRREGALDGERQKEESGKKRLDGERQKEEEWSESARARAPCVFPLIFVSLSFTCSLSRARSDSLSVSLSLSRFNCFRR